MDKFALDTFHVDCVAGSGRSGLAGAQFRDTPFGERVILLHVIADVRNVLKS